MKITLQEKLIAYFALLGGLSISAVAIYYSVMGLVSIFASAVVPILVMGIILEIAKLIATLWLKQNWSITPLLIKFYLIVSILILMTVTSIGIFGFLSKAHSDQLLVTGNNTIQIAELDRQISIEKRNIDDSIRVISQLDQAVQALIDANRIRGTTGSIAIRNNQADERKNLNNIINESTNKINQLEKQKLPLLQEKLNIEAEVGPLKYLATLIYGTQNKDVLEKSVTWMILILVCVFDPLAVVLLLASQISFRNFNSRKLDNNSSQYTSVSTGINLDLNKSPFEQEKIEPILEKESAIHSENNNWKESTSFTTGPIEKNIEKDFNLDDHPYLFKTPTLRHPPGIEPVKPIVYNSTVDTVNTLTDKIIEVDNIDNTKFSNTDNLTTMTNALLNSKLEMLKQKEMKIKFLVQQVKEGRIDLNQVPSNLLADVKVRV